MVFARRTVFAIFLAVASLASVQASAGQIGEDGDARRILIADPSPALRSYLSNQHFAVESSEHLDALNFSLVIVLPPSLVRAADALRDLQAKFPAAIVALDDPFFLAQGSLPHRAGTARAQRILTAIAWQAEAPQADSGIRIGVIDSAIDPAHPALQGASIVQRNFTSGRPATTDTVHGTAIAAMLVGRSDGRSVAGLLSGATLFHASIFGSSRQGPKASSADFLRATDWLLRSGVRIINASITSPSKNAVVVYAMAVLSNQQAIVIAAAGNRGPDGPPVYPAAIDSAFAVTAVSIDGDAYPYANTGDYIDIAAPGINVPTTSRRITSGTSVAVPFVTAAVARMVETCDVSPAIAQAILQADARDLGPRGWDSHFGWGLLQAGGCGPTATQLTGVDFTHELR